MFHKRPKTCIWIFLWKTELKYKALFPLHLHFRLSTQHFQVWSSKTFHAQETSVRNSQSINIRKTRLVSNYQLNAQFLYSITMYMLHYNPRHVPSSTLLIFRRTNCIITASGIVTLCKWPYSRPVDSGLRSAVRSQPAYCTESDDTRCCNNTICPPEDEQGTARNMLRIIM